MHNTPTTSSDKTVRYLRRQGVRATVTPDRAARHIALLRRAGMRDPQIAAAANRSPATLYRIAKRHTPTISRQTEAMILAIPIPPQPAPDSRTHTHSHGTARRLQALVHGGHPPRLLAAMLGMHRQQLHALLHQQHQTIELHVAQRVEALYLEWWHQPAEQHAVSSEDASRARQLADQHQWQPAAAWDDIDHPHATPDRGAHVSRLVAIVEDTAELAREGYSREGIAVRLGGIGWDAVRQAHRRAGVELPALYD